jgi:hypothetical protein
LIPTVTVRCDRQTAGGGVCAFIRKPIILTEVALAKPCVEFEMCCFDILLNQTAIRFINVYRPPPDYNNFEHLSECLLDALRTTDPCVITGDFNCPEIDWDNFTTLHDGMQDKFLELIESAGLNQLVEKPTRGDNILDLVFSDESLKVSNLTVSQQFSKSDHCQVSVSVFIDDSHASADCGTIACHKYYNWDHVNFEQIAQYLATINWYDILTVNLTADSLLAAFYQVLLEAFEKFMPHKYVAHSTNLPKPKLAVRYPPKIRRAIARKCCLWRHHKANPNDGKIATAYKQAENKCKQLIHSFELEKKTLGYR